MTPTPLCNLFSFICNIQRLRSASEPLPSWEYQGASVETALALAWGEAEGSLMAFPLPPAKGRQAADQVLLWRPVRARLPAGPAHVILAAPDDLRPCPR